MDLTTQLRNLVDERGEGELRKKEIPSAARSPPVGKKTTDEDEENTA